MRLNKETGLYEISESDKRKVQMYLRKLNKNVKGHLKYKSYFDRKSGIFSYVEIEDTRVKEDKNIEEILECRND